MVDLTTDQIAIRNLCIKLQGYIASASMTKGSEDLIETSMKLVCNTLIDVNRIANALEERNKLDQIVSVVQGLELRAVDAAQKPAVFIYKNHKGEVEPREVKDWKIEWIEAPGFNYDAGWFISGTDTKRNAHRSFRIDERMRPIG